MPAPVVPQSPLAYRSAKLAVIILTALIILALIGLVVGAVLKLSDRSALPTGGGAGSELVLPPGAKIISSETQTDRLILHIRSPDGEEIDIISTLDGRLIGRVRTSRYSSATPR